MSIIRVMIVDDDEVIRSSLRLLVDHESDMIVVSEASNGHEAVLLARRHCPDVVLMDVQMPRMDGLEATREICAKSNEDGRPRVIVLTTFNFDSYVFEALRAGASGFLLKNSPPTDVLRAIRVAHEGDALLAPEITRRLIDQFTTGQKPTIGGGSHQRMSTELARLTDRERETLILIGRGLSNSEIASALFVTPTTVRTYVSRILAKLVARDRAQLVVMAYENGLVGS